MEWRLPRALHRHALVLFNLLIDKIWMRQPVFHIITHLNRHNLACVFLHLWIILGKIIVCALLHKGWWDLFILIYLMTVHLNLRHHRVHLILLDLGAESKRIDRGHRWLVDLGEFLAKRLILIGYRFRSWLHTDTAVNNHPGWFDRWITCSADANHCMIALDQPLLGVRGVWMVMLSKYW